MRPIGLSLALSAAFVATVVSATVTDPSVLDACPGYKATGVVTKGSTLTANLVLAGKACNVFGNDTEVLSLQVTYETSETFPSHMFHIFYSSFHFSISYSCQDHGSVVGPL